MDRTLSQPLTENEIHALVDGLVSVVEQTALQARLALDPDAQTKVTKWQHQRNALRGLYQPVASEPVPPTLMTAAQQTAASQQEVSQWWRWGGMAAGVFLAFGAGWLSHGEWEVQSTSSVLAKNRVVQDFARQANFAHAVYTPEIRHPVEVTAAEQDHLVQWLSKRVGKPLKVPNLLPQGYELVGGRLLPGEAGARAQFMFQNAERTRITLYLGVVDKMPGSAEARETGFQFVSDGPIPSFYWIDHGFGYALAGQVPREALLKLAEVVYRQLLS